MTRIDNTVSLSWGDWLGVVVTIACGLGGQWLLLQGRVATLEANLNAVQRQVDAIEVRQGETRKELLGELRAMRAELKAR